MRAFRPTCSRSDRRLTHNCHDTTGVTQHRRIEGEQIVDMRLEVRTDLLREAEEHHRQYEPTAPKHHWSGWYAASIIAREQGSSPDAASVAAELHIEGPGS